MPAILRWRPTWVLAVSRRRFRIALARTRQWCQEDARQLAAMDRLSAEQRRILTAALRSWNVRTAAAFPFGWVVLFYTGTVAAASACLLAPALVLGAAARHQLDAAEIVLAAGTYLTIFGIVSALYFRRLTRSALRVPLESLTFIGTTASLGMAMPAAAWVGATQGRHVWSPVRFGLEGSALALIVIAIVHWLVRTTWSILSPAFFRRCGTLPPSLMVAVHLAYLLGTFNELDGVWRQAAARRRLVRRLAAKAWYVERLIPRMIWCVGVRSSAHTEATRRCRHAAAVLRAMQWRLVDARARADYDKLRDELTAAMVSVAGGDWSPLTSSDEPVRTARVAVLGRRLITPSVLVATALALPHLPGVAVAGSALTGIQVGLLVAAALGLTSVDSSVPDRIMGALGSADRQGP